MRLTASLLAALELGLCVLASTVVGDEATTGPVASEGCATADLKFPATPGGSSKALKFGDRIVRVTLPQNYVHGTPAPLILAYHDQSSTATKMEAMTLLSRPDRNPDAIVVYPQAGMEDRWQSHWDPPKKINDLAFTSELLDRLSSRLCVDLDRIYATGLGTGGGMVHLLSCNGELSTRIAAFSVINGLLIQGFATGTDKLQVKDAASLLWHNCKPKRVPIRMLEIHGENNTLCGYWGAEPVNKRKLLPIVRWLVDWSMRNKCGQSFGMPKRWRGDMDPIHKTILERGYIFEGMIENGTVIKASYHCWPADKSEDEKALNKFLQGLPPSLEDIFDSPGDHSLDNAKVEKQKADLEEWAKAAGRVVISEADENEVASKADEEKQLHEALLIEHYFVRGFGHGWPRVQKQPPPEDGSPSKPAMMRPWSNLKSNFRIDSEAKSPSTFHYGFDDPSPSRLPAFDATDRVLDFFRMYKLSDEVRAAPENEAELRGDEPSRIDEIIQTFKDQIDANSRAVAEREDEVMAKIKAENKPSEETSTEGKSNERDEL